MSDLLAKCDWDEDELHVHITEWPEVVYVWVDEKTMPYAPVVADVRSLQAETKALRELVRDMWPHVRHRSRMCGECELPCDTSDECLLYEPMRQRMRKLGVEVES